MHEIDFLAAENSIFLLVEASVCFGSTTNFEQKLFRHKNHCAEHNIISKLMHTYHLIDHASTRV